MKKVIKILLLLLTCASPARLQSMVKNFMLATTASMAGGIVVLLNAYIGKQQNWYLETIDNALQGLVEEATPSPSKLEKFENLLGYKTGRRSYVTDKKKSLLIIADALKRGLNPNKPMRGGHLPLHRAVSHGNRAIIRLLLEYGARMDLQDTDKKYPLSLAPDIAIMKLLLSKGANPNLPDASDETALHILLSGKPDPKKIRLLLSYGARCDIANKYGETPLLTLCMHTEIDSEVLSILLARKDDCDVNHQDLSHNTALHLAVQKHAYGAIKLLIDHRSNPLLKNLQGKTAFDLSCSTRIDAELQRGLDASGTVEDSCTCPDYEDCKPFESDEAVKDAYRALRKKIEQNFQQHGGEEKITRLLRDEILLFCQRLMRFKVAKDIAKKKPYTKTLGLKVNDEGFLTMALLPPTLDTFQPPGSGGPASEIEEQNRLLFILSIDRGRKGILEQLQKLQKKRINHAPGQSAKIFFPKIIVDDGFVGKDSMGKYSPYKSRIVISEELLAGDHWPLTVMHEFIHYLQDITGREMGGVDTAPTSDEARNESFNDTLDEYYAEKGAMKCHPDPESLLRKFRGGLLAEGYCTEKHEMVAQLLKGFPYFSRCTGHAVLVKKQKKKDAQLFIWESEKNLLSGYDDLGPEIEKRMRGVKEKVEQLAQLPNDATTCEKLAFETHDSEEKFKRGTEKIKRRLRSYYEKKKKLTPKLRKKIDNAKNYRCGSRAFLKLKEELGLIPA